VWYLNETLHLFVLSAYIGLHVRTDHDANYNNNSGDLEVLLPPWTRRRWSGEIDAESRSELVAAHLADGLVGWRWRAALCWLASLSHLDQLLLRIVRHFRDSLHDEPRSITARFILGE
jgi:hypothetical protein